MFQFTDEKSIFDFLGMKYKKPEERIDGRSIQLQEMAYTTFSEKTLAFCDSGKG